MNETTYTSADQPAALDAAFEALKTYDAGSPRGLLCPLDEAVIETLRDSTARRAMEGRLLSGLKGKPSAPAVEYICAKLALIGSDTCVTALAELLSDPVSSTCARNALEKVPGRAAGKALRRALPKLGPPEQAGAIQSLGTRRETASVSTLAKYLRSPVAEVAVASAMALGQIGSSKAGKALRTGLDSGAESVRSAAADALLVNAEHLLVGGRNAEARSSYQALLAAGVARHVQRAAARGLTKCAPTRNHSPGT